MKYQEILKNKTDIHSIKNSCEDELIKTQVKKLDFNCVRCGACCSQLPLFHGIYGELDRGDGICRHFDEQKRICRIYEHRPDLCNVRKGYALFKRNITWEMYVEQVKQGCLLLRAQQKNCGE